MVSFNLGMKFSHVIDKSNLQVIHQRGELEFQALRARLHGSFHHRAGISARLPEMKFQLSSLVNDLQIVLVDYIGNFHPWVETHHRAEISALFALPGMKI